MRGKQVFSARFKNIGIIPAKRNAQYIFVYVLMREWVYNTHSSTQFGKQTDVSALVHIILLNRIGF